MKIIQEKLNEDEFSIMDHEKIQKSFSFQRLTKEFFAIMKESIEETINTTDSLDEIDDLEYDLAVFCREQGLKEMDHTFKSISDEKVMAALGLFTALCIAAGWLIRIIRGIKKPGDDINEKINRDSKRLNKMEDEVNYIKKAMAVLMRTNLIQLKHMRTGNETGEIAKAESEIQNFLIQN